MAYYFHEEYSYFWKWERSFSHLNSLFGMVDRLYSFLYCYVRVILISKKFIKKIKDTDGFHSLQLSALYELRNVKSSLVMDEILSIVLHHPIQKSKFMPFLSLDSFLHKKINWKASYNKIIQYIHSACCVTSGVATLLKNDQTEYIIKTHDWDINVFKLDICMYFLYRQIEVHWNQFSVAPLSMRPWDSSFGTLNNTHENTNS